MPGHVINLISSVQRPSNASSLGPQHRLSLSDNGHIPRIGRIAEDMTEAKLAAELQHRVRNIMACFAR